MKKYTLEFVVFTCGAAVMVLELIAARLLAPYLGTSYFVWTSIIGIIMASLSLGYWFGGNLADSKPSRNMLTIVIFASAIFIAIVAFTNSFVLELIQHYFDDIRIGGIVATTTLFAFPSILLGMVSPYAVKLKMDNVDSSGATVGNLYAISTIGSIVGTFLSGFVLVPYFGSTKVLLLLSAVLIVTSYLFILQRLRLTVKIVSIILLLALLYTVLSANFSVTARHGLIDIDTLYERVWIYDEIDEYGTNKLVRRMQTGNSKGSVSSMFLENDDPVYDYIYFYDLVEHFNPNFKKSLMIGGGAYSYPKYYLNKYPDAEIDVVEIDPKLTELAKKYFRLPDDNPRLSIYHTDGRIYLNKNEKKYDAIFGDAFKSVHSVPHQLTTKEAIQKMYDSLTDDGVALVNLISAIEGEKGEFLRAEYATYKAVFSQVYLFPVYTNNTETIQNIILVALKSKQKPSFESQIPQINRYLSRLYSRPIPEDIPILTDDYAPVDYYIMKTI